MTDNTNLTTKVKMPTFGMKKGIAANRAQAEKTINEIDPNKVPNRLALAFDDSGSMSGEPIDHAHIAVKGFTAACDFNNTSIAIYPLNAENKGLTVDYDILNMYIMGVGATGGTPLYTTLLKIIENENVTRTVVFSDGSPTDSKLLGYAESWDSKPKEFALKVIKEYTDKEIPIDTIYIGMETASGYKEMKEIADRTGGIFIHFKDSSSLSHNLKYLAPKYRALLMNADLKSKVERGESL